MRKSLIAVAVLAVAAGTVLLTLDRVGAGQAEQRIAESLAGYLRDRAVTSSPPQVSVTGFPFLTQAVAGEYREVRVSLGDVRGGPLLMPLRSARVVAYDVRAPLKSVLDGHPQVVIDRVEGEGVLAYSDLVKEAGLAGFTVTGAGGSTLELRGSVPIVGTVTGSAEVSADSDRIRIRVTDLDTDSEAVSALAKQLVARYSDRAFVVKVPGGLLFGAELTGVEADPEGLQVRFAAADVEVS